MKSRAFTICLAAPIGERRGFLRFTESDAGIHGTLGLLGREEPIDGRIDDSGQITLEGRLVSLVRSMSYHATGTLIDGELLLDLLYGTRHMTLTGREMAL